MKPNKLYLASSLVFLLLSVLVFSYSGYYILGIQTVNLFLALIAMAYITSFIAVMKNRKFVIAWLLLIVNSIVLICIIYFLTHFKMKM
ncbi:hypothetical protein [Pedobacter zeae]|uniref:Glucose-6-phosphate-specific signal transduction histidine kinase n=1 Tax=Pedobacter zeae TaxID=1737356 RepID=A0A7W6K7Y9_9SPHI|nr:hypothetical protein [Pedobacter zeae]MBB4106848.1 glucose-6-phosphate-specific signal transduction histidine kinase [Pedobacter zeae]GGH04121.1 hypothetical protein GCM10007422_19560 [Pedobacter zeae]